MIFNNSTSHAFHRTHHFEQPHFLLDGSPPNCHLSNVLVECTDMNAFSEWLKILYAIKDTNANSSHVERTLTRSMSACAGCVDKEQRIRVKDSRIQELEAEVASLKRVIRSLEVVEDDCMADPDYMPSQILSNEPELDPKFTELVNHEQVGCIKRYSPTLATFSIKLMVDCMIPGECITTLLETIQGTFNVWSGCSIPTPRYFQSIRDTLSYLNDEHSRRLGFEEVAPRL